MASLFLRSNGVYYVLSLIKGRRVWRSTGTKDKSEALRFLAETRYVLGEIRSLRLEQFRARLFPFLQSSLAPSTVALYRSGFNKFSSLVGDLPLNAITPQHVEKFKLLRSKEVGSVKVNIDFRVLKAAFNIAVDWDLIKQNPFKKCKQIRIPSQRPVYLTHEEFNRVVETIDLNWYKEIIIFAVSTMMRLAEIVNLQWMSVDLGRREINVENTDEFRLKTQKPRTIPMNAWVFEMLSNKQNKMGRVFTFPDEKEARAHGKYTHLKGVVYKSIHPSNHRHTIDPGKFQQSEHKIYCICDPHDAKPPLIGWGAVDKYAHAKLIYEFPNLDLGYKPFHQIKNWSLTTEQVCQQIKEIEQSFGWDPQKITRVMDPNFAQKREAEHGRTVKEQFSYYGRKIDWPMLFSTKVNDGLEAGHRIVRDWLAPNADGIVRLKIAMDCTNIWHDMTHYAYDPRQGRALERHGEGERVELRFKDGADIIRYWMMFMNMKPAQEEKEETEVLEWYEEIEQYNHPRKRR